jgi:hypothetical protein
VVSGRASPSPLRLLGGGNIPSFTKNAVPIGCIFLIRPNRKPPSGDQPPHLDAAGNAFYKRNRQRCLHLKRWKEGKSTQRPFSPSRQSADQISGIRGSKNFRPCFCPSPQMPPPLLNGQEARKVNGPPRAPNP